PPGTILGGTSDHLRVAAGRGGVDVLSVQPEGKRAMSGREDLVGHPLVSGERLSREALFDPHGGRRSGSCERFSEGDARYRPPSRLHAHLWKMSAIARSRPRLRPASSAGAVHWTT